MKKNLDQIKFETSHKGKCDTCKENKQLDAMVRKGKKGLYECIDCKVDSEKNTLEDYLSVMHTEDATEVKMTAGKFKKIIKWVVG